MMSRCSDNWCALMTFQGQGIVDASYKDHSMGYISHNGCIVFLKLKPVTNGYYAHRDFVHRVIHLAWPWHWNVS